MQALRFRTPTRLRATRRGATIVVAAVCTAMFVGATGAARADDPAPCSTETPYTMQLEALAGPAGAGLTIAVAATAGCEVPDVLKKVQVKTFAADGALDQTRNLTDVTAPGGIAKDIDLGDVPRDRRIEAVVLIQPGRTYVLRGTTKTLLRPDLIVKEIAPQQTLVGKPVVISAVISAATVTSALPRLSRCRRSPGPTSPSPFPPAGTSPSGSPKSPSGPPSRSM